MMDHAKFWDKFADRYAKRPVSDVASWDETLRRTMACFPANASVLEVGCGTGSSAIRMAPATYRLTGTDISPAMIEIAKAKAAKIENLDFAVGTLATATITYDVVVAFNLLHLLENVPAAAHEAFAATKSGGTFVSKSATLGDGKAFLRPIIAVLRFIGKAPFVNFLTSKSLDQAMTDAGFIIETADMIPTGSTNRFIIARKP